MNPQQDPMQSPWHQQLGLAGAVYDPETDALLHFGQPGAEIEAAATGTVLVPLLHLACLGAEGEEARDFLHNQFTNDIKHLQPGQAQFSAWCTAKGRMVASFVNYADFAAPDSFRLIMAAELLPATQKRLQMFVLRAKVKLQDLSGQTALLGLAGPNAGAALAAAGLSAPGADLASTDNAGVVVIRLPGERFILASPQNQAAGLWQRLAAHATPAGLLAWRWLDVQNAHPWVTGPTREEFVPQMADFEKLGGVSFHKGCYPGQEVVARTQYLGKVKRHLYRLKSPVPLQAGEDLHSPASPDQAAGKVVTCAPDRGEGYVALAVLLANCAEDLHQGGMEGPRLSAAAVNP